MAAHFPGTKRAEDIPPRAPGVGNIKSSFALKQVKYQTALPLPQRGGGSKAAGRVRGGR